MKQLRFPVLTLAFLLCAGWPAPSVAGQNSSKAASAWPSRFELGLSGSEGTSSTLDFRAAVNTDHKSTRKELKLDSAYYYGRSEGETTKDQFTAGGRQDWFLPNSPWLYFAQGRYDYNSFQTWTQRLGAHGGGGYQYINRPDLSLTQRFGGGVIQEFGSEQKDPKLEALLALDFNHSLGERQKLNAHLTLYPDLSYLGQYRVVSAADWSTRISGADRLDLKIGMTDEYISQTRPGIKKNNLNYYTSLVLHF